jgi:hypothetical protein
MNKKILNFTESNLSVVSEKSYDATDDNIISVGYGFKRIGDLVTNEKSLIFGVKQKKKLDELNEDEIIPAYVSVDGQVIQTDVVEMAEVTTMVNCGGDFYAWQSSPPPNQGLIRPIEGGSSAINYTEMAGYACTLGFLAKDNYDGAVVGISNVHCAATEPFAPVNPTLYNGVYVTNQIVQPSETAQPELDGVAFLKRISFLKPSSSNQADVAVYSLNKDFVQSTYKQVGLSSINNDLPFATCSELADLLKTDPYLYSSGRTTGPKGEGDIKLKINRINTTIQVGYYGDQNPKIIKFTDVIGFIAVPSSEVAKGRPYSIQCDWPIKGGDSGSCLIADINGEKKIIGLVFAGSIQNGICKEGFACNIQSVALAANIRSLASESGPVSPSPSTVFV